ncbi:MAG: YbjN domain-containing protein [Anaerolineales bacterium]|nr:YbjN domain-containing protein [Anaerolineales bacterium]
MSEAPGEPPGGIYAVMLDFFETDGWPYEALAGQPVLRLPFRGAAGNWLCFAQAREAQHQFVFYSVYPAPTPAHRRGAMAELLTRANYGLVVGNFELDFADGEVRYKTSVDVEGSALTRPLVRACVYANVLMMDQYLPGLAALLAEGLEPTAALARVEGR